MPSVFLHTWKHARKACSGGCRQTRARIVGRRKDQTQLRNVGAAAAVGAPRVFIRRVRGGQAAGAATRRHSGGSWRRSGRAQGRGAAARRRRAAGSGQCCGSGGHGVSASADAQGAKPTLWQTCGATLPSCASASSQLHVSRADHTCASGDLYFHFCAPRITMRSYLCSL